MNAAMNADTIDECLRLSFADTPFPVILDKLAGAGVRSYAVDLFLARETYYGETGEALDKTMPLENVPAIAERFDAAAVEQTVRAIQSGKIGYAEFIRRVMAAGCTGYRVFIGGGKVMYFGRHGDVWAEGFPPRN